jgi:hypothetical protein
MHTDSRLGIFDDVLANASADVRAIALRLRSIIDVLHPDCIEVPRPGEPSAGYGVGSKKMSETYAYLMPQSSYVNLGFYHGAALTDTAKLLEGSGKALRHMKVRSLEDANRVAVRDLLLESIAERKKALGMA